MLIYLTVLVARPAGPLAAGGETGGRDALSQLQGGGARAPGLLVEIGEIFCL